MKKQAYTLIATIILVGSMAIAAKAQASGNTQINANIPFEFSVGNKTLPAGEYVVSQVNTAVNPGVLAFRSRDDSSRALIQMNSVVGKAQENATLMFHRYGNKYFFAQAWVIGENSGLQAPKSRAERTAERELAGIKTKSETIALRTR
jgi:hypothetical protein